MATFFFRTLWWTNIAMERSTIFHGKIHYFYGHFPLLFVCSPEGSDRSIPFMPHDIMRQTPALASRCSRAPRQSVRCEMNKFDDMMHLGWWNVWNVPDFIHKRYIKDLGWRNEPRFSFSGTQGALPRRHHSDCFEIVMASGNQRWLAGKSPRNMDSMNGKIIHKYLYSWVNYNDLTATSL